MGIAVVVERDAEAPGLRVIRIKAAEELVVLIAVAHIEIPNLAARLLLRLAQQRLHLIAQVTRRSGEAN